MYFKTKEEYERDLWILQNNLEALKASEKKLLNALSIIAILNLITLTIAIIKICL